jgi:hypothetical protein
MTGSGSDRHIICATALPFKNNVPVAGAAGQRALPMRRVE